jgi:SPOR domain
MITRFRFEEFALDATESQTNGGDVDVLPVPTLDERVNLYLRAVHGNREFTREERSNARDVLLNSMAAQIAALPAEQSPKGELPGYETTDGSRPLHPYETAAQSVQRNEAIRVAPTPIARRRTSILALTATLGLVLIVAGATLDYRWTHPHLGEEVSESSRQDRVPPPTTSPRSLSTQHVVQIASQRSEADVLAVFRRLQQEQPTLFSQTTLSRIDLGPQTTGDRRIDLRSYSARIGPFASEKDAAAACLALAAADIRCF